MEKEVVSTETIECAGVTRKGGLRDTALHKDDKVPVLLKIFRDGVTAVSCPLLNASSGDCEAGEPMEQCATQREIFPSCAFLRERKSC